MLLVGGVRRGRQLAVPPVINGRLRVEVVGCTKRCVVQLGWVVMMNYLLLMLLMLLMLMLMLMMMLILLMLLLLLLLMLLLL